MMRNDRVDDCEGRRGVQVDPQGLAPGAPVRGDADREVEQAMPVVSAPRVERSVGEVAPVRRQTTYDADDLEIPSFLRRK